VRESIVEEFQLKITGMKSTIVAVPLKTVEPSAVDLMGLRPRISVIIEISTDSGLTGVGESVVVSGAEISKLIVDSAKPLLLGGDPLMVERIRRKLYARFNLIHVHLQAANWALSGIEMALWDIVGKACKQPLSRLWGGAYRKKVKYLGGVPHQTIPVIQAEARRLVEEGFDSLYEKVGLDPWHDLESVRAIRDAVGYDVELRVDANQAWSIGTAVRMIKKMERYDLEFVEQPVIMYNLDGLARVRKAVSIPILSHESSWTFYDALNVIKHDAADAIQLDPKFDGGLSGFRTAAGMAEAAGMSAVCHHFSELGISTAYSIHATASCPAFIHANQTGYRILSDDILEDGMLKLDKGHFNVPTGPGLGVGIDQSKLKKYAELFEREIRGREFVEHGNVESQSPRKFLGVADEAEDYVPRASRF
jgi:L-alanine-DL-glutamate epimerase-like enolase superfamily enzyme